MYFCELTVLHKLGVTLLTFQPGFIAFTTIGYGDLAPVTPIGRAVFVFWALLGVGAMTILISGMYSGTSGTIYRVSQSNSVITDAFSQRFHTAMHSKSYDRAIRHYMQRQRRSLQRNDSTMQKKFFTDVTADPVLEASLANPQVKYSKTSGSKSVSQGIEQPLRKLEQMESSLKAQMEPFPTMIIGQMKKFHDDLQYFLISNGHAGELATFEVQNDGQLASQGLQPPESLRRFLDEIAENEDMGERTKEEIWADHHSRNVGSILTDCHMFLTRRPIDAVCPRYRE
jgi:potassium channel subfamily K, other eukaryote